MIALQIITQSGTNSALLDGLCTSGYIPFGDTDKNGIQRYAFVTDDAPLGTFTSVVAPTLLAKLVERVEGDDETILDISDAAVMDRSSRANQLALALTNPNVVALGKRSDQ